MAESSSSLYPFSHNNASGGFPCYVMVCFLNVRNIKILANILTGSISRLLLPVHMPCQCPALLLLIVVSARLYLLYEGIEKNVLDK